MSICLSEDTKYPKNLPVIHKETLHPSAEVLRATDERAKR